MFSSVQQKYVSENCATVRLHKERAGKMMALHTLHWIYQQYFSSVNNVLKTITNQTTVSYNFTPLKLMGDL